MIPQLAWAYRGALVMPEMLLSNDEDCGDVAGGLVHPAVTRSVASRIVRMGNGRGRACGYDGMVIIVIDLIHK
jgi:hypothetical protein